MGTNRLVSVMASKGKIKRMADCLVGMLLYAIIFMVSVVAATALSVYVFGNNTFPHGTIRIKKVTFVS